MKHNSLKEKFNNFNPVSQPEDWEKMEELLDKPSSAFSFLTYIITITVAGMGLLFLYSYNVKSENQPSNIKKSPVAAIENPFEKDNTPVKVSNELKVERMAVEVEKEISYNSSEQFRITSPEDLTRMGESITFLDKSVPSVENISALQSSSFSYSIDEEEERYREDHVEMIEILPSKSTLVLQENKPITLHSSLLQTNTSFFSLEISANYSVPLSLNRNVAAINHLGSMGAVVGFNNWTLIAKAGRSTIIAPTKVVLSSVKRTHPFSNAGALNPYFENISSTHFELSFGRVYMISNRISLHPFAGAGMINFRQKIYAENISDESFHNPDITNSLSAHKAENVKGNIYFLQAGVTGRYHFNGGWNLSTGISYQNTLSTKSSYPLHFFTPTLGLGYQFSL